VFQDKNEQRKATTKSKEDGAYKKHPEDAFSERASLRVGKYFSIILLSLSKYKF